LWGVARSFAEAESKSSWMRRKIANRLARRPIRDAWQEFVRRSPAEHEINEQFDRSYGTDTAAEVPLVETGVTAEDALRGKGIYRPIWESDFHNALAALEVGVEGFTFVDIGSGKGKILMMAADYPFAKILGVEYSPGLHAIAQRNLQIYRSPAQRCSDLVSIHADALDYRLPDGPLVCLVFNALDSTTMRRFVRHVQDDLAERAAPAYLLYVNVRHIAEIGDGLDGIRRLRRIVDKRKLVVFANAAGERQRTVGRQGISQPRANAAKATAPATSQRIKANTPPAGDSVASAGSTGL